MNYQVKVWLRTITTRLSITLCKTWILLFPKLYCNGYYKSKKKKACNMKEKSACAWSQNSFTILQSILKDASYSKPLWLCFIQEYVFFWELALCRLTHFALQSLGAPACHELVDSWMYVILILSEMSVPYLCAENFTVFVVS